MSNHRTHQQIDWSLLIHPLYPSHLRYNIIEDGIVVTRYPSRPQAFSYGAGLPRSRVKASNHNPAFIPSPKNEGSTAFPASIGLPPSINSSLENPRGFTAVALPRPGFTNFGFCQEILHRLPLWSLGQWWIAQQLPYSILRISQPKRDRGTS